MKKILLLLTLPILFCNLSAQNVNDDVVKLQKSNASLRGRLNQQNEILLKQMQKTDSLAALLQSNSNEIEKIAANQKNVSKSMDKVNAQTSNMNKATADISDAFGKRKLYAMIAGAIGLIILLVMFFMIRKKFTTLSMEMKQSEENMNKSMTQLNEFVDKEIGELKMLLEKHSKEMNLAIERQSIENKSMLTKQTTESNQRIDKVNADTNKAIGEQIQAVKGLFQEQLSKSANEINKKIAEIKIQ